MPLHGVAVTVPEPWGTQLQSAREEFGDPMASAIPPHVTLLPPTAVDPDDLEPFVAHLQRVCADVAPFEMVLSGTGTFRPVSPVVFVQVSSGIAPCEQLERAVRSGPVERVLEFPYHPHVTIAHHLGEPELDRAFEGMAGFRCEFPVTSVELYQHDPDGVWRVVRSFDLEGTPEA
ncbi:2'-5' RNA ligase family protein [Nostocoides sp. Soil756]|jgi:2'-5' RNA ligase|uniref:2'-5' RNA ligase family protein n=1 Tax=Nostocoides sp. Soil756 TaxID=1736399 RepID=UPI0006F5A60C|nr:2'-5' RNA ligase family protein [Tetrasphaera sp. Soil756]KRE62166.1 2'-5' RNA ligase [Tetrasphaera sp. Soil756]